MDVSIVMAYYNRKPQLYKTLETISQSKFRGNLEVIIVDDGSDDEHRLDSVNQDFNLNIKVIRINPEDKWYKNPCIPFNKGFSAATGEIIIIQNPECCHLGDVVSMATRVSKNQYFTFHAYSLDKAQTESLKEINLSTDPLPFELMEGTAGLEGTTGYYNHAKFRPVAFHFCSAMHRSNLEKLNGFDERYAKGIGFDDNEFLVRITRLGLNIAFVASPFVLHQYHYNEGGQFENMIMKGVDRELVAANQLLFNNVTLQETTWRASNENSGICTT